MGREVRRVPKDWQHPKNDHGIFIPLCDGANNAFAAADAEWNLGREKWQQGLREDFGGDGLWKPIEEKYRYTTYTDWAGARPNPDDYMPCWGDEADHLMMYENTSEGTPISPAFKTPEELARWLADNGASAFGSRTASYEGWLRVAKGGYAPSMVVSQEGVQSGVDAL